MSAELRLIRLTAADASARSDDYAEFEQLILQNETAYPGIGKWLRNKVAAGLRTSERIAFIGFLDDKPIASAVVKRGSSAKFCHLRLDETVRDRTLGDLFFCLMAAEIRRSATEVHFTLPESLWSEKTDFFRGFGFERAEKASTQYRIFDTELRCSAPFDRVWSAVLQKLPKIGQRFNVRGHSLNAPLVLSVAPRFAEKILSGDKAVEVRRRFSRKWIGTRAVVYATSPQRRLLGDARIANVVCARPDEIWQTFGEAIGCTRAELDAYATHCERLFALVLDEVTPFVEPVSLSQLEFLVQRPLRAPQSYCSVAADEAWSAAVSVAALLHGSVRTRVRQVVSDVVGLPATRQMSLLS